MPMTSSTLAVHQQRREVCQGLGSTLDSQSQKWSSGQRAESWRKLSRKAEKKSENGSVDFGHPIEAPFATVHFAKHQHFFPKAALEGSGHQLPWRNILH